MNLLPRPLAAALAFVAFILPASLHAQSDLMLDPDKMPAPQARPALVKKGAKRPVPVARGELAASSLPDPSKAYPDLRVYEHPYHSLTAIFSVSGTRAFNKPPPGVTGPIEGQAVLNLKLHVQVAHSPTGEAVRGMRVLGARTITSIQSGTSSATSLATQTPARGTKLPAKPPPAKRTVTTHDYTVNMPFQVSNAPGCAATLYWSEQLARGAIKLSFNEQLNWVGSGGYPAMLGGRVSIPFDISGTTKNFTGSTQTGSADAGRVLALHAVIPDSGLPDSAFGAAAKAALAKPPALTKTPVLWLEAARPVGAKDQITTTVVKIPMYYMEKNGVGEFLTEGMLKDKRIPAMRMGDGTVEDIVWPALLELRWNASRNPYAQQPPPVMVMTLEPKNPGAYKNWKPAYGEKVTFVARIKSRDPAKPPVPAQIIFQLYDKYRAPSPGVTTPTASMYIDSQANPNLLVMPTTSLARTRQPVLEAEITVTAGADWIEGDLRARAFNPEMFATWPDTGQPLIPIPYKK